MSDLLTYLGGHPIRLHDNGDGTYSIAVGDDYRVATGGSETTLVDTGVNFEADVLIGKILKLVVNGVEFYRTITDNDATTLTFAKLKDAVDPMVVYSGVTATASETGAEGNSYTLIIDGDTAAVRSLSAAFDEDTELLTVKLAVAADDSPEAVVNAGAVDEGDDGVITVALAAGTAGNGVVLTVVDPETESGALAVAYDSGARTVIVTLATAEGDLDPTANTANLVTAAINDETGLTGTLTGDGTAVVEPQGPVVFAGGTHVLNDAANTKALVAAAINDLEDFTGASEGTGVVPPSGILSFSGGEDSYKAGAGTLYKVFMDFPVPAS